MPPGFPTLPELVSGIISAFLKLFSDPATTSIKASISILLGVSSVNLLSSEVLNLYSEMWGVGIAVSFVSGAWRWFEGYRHNDGDEMRDSVLLPIRELIFGKLSPAFFGVCFYAVHEFSVGISKNLPESNLLVNTLSSLNPANLIMHWAVTLIFVVVALILAVEVTFITVIMPVFLFVASPVAFAFSGGSRPNKLYATFLALSWASLLSCPAMIICLLFTNFALVRIQTNFVAFLDYRDPILCVMLLVCVYIPRLIYVKVKDRVNISLFDGGLTIYGQAQAAEAARQQRILEQLESQNSHHVRDLLGTAALIYGGAVAAGAIGAMEAGGATVGATEATGSVMSALRAKASHPATSHSGRIGIAAVLTASSHAIRRRHQPSSDSEETTEGDS